MVLGLIRAFLQDDALTSNILRISVSNILKTGENYDSSLSSKIPFSSVDDCFSGRIYMPKHIGTINSFY